MVNYQNYHKRYYLHDMVNCFDQHIAWLSLLVAVFLLLFWTPSKCTCCMHRCIPSEGNVAASMVRNWLIYVSGLQLNLLSIGIWWTELFMDYIAKNPEGLDSDRWIPLRGGARIPRGLSPSGILATPRVRDSPIWIQPRGVFRINPTPGS